MHVGVAGEMLSKSSLQICSFRASPRTIGGCHHLEWYRAASCQPPGATEPAGRRGGQCLAALGSVWQCKPVLCAYQVATSKASRAGGGCTGKG